MKPKQRRSPFAELSFAGRADKFHDFLCLLIWSHWYQIAKYQLFVSSYEISIIALARAECLKGRVQPFVTLNIWKAVKEFLQRTSLNAHPQRFGIKIADFAVAFQHLAPDSIDTPN